MIFHRLFKSDHFTVQEFNKLSNYIYIIENTTSFINLKKY